jgi:hypothetical protein
VPESIRYPEMVPAWHPEGTNLVFSMSMSMYQAGTMTVPNWHSEGTKVVPSSYQPGTPLVYHGDDNQVYCINMVTSKNTSVLP